MIPQPTVVLRSMLENAELSIPAIQPICFKECHNMSACEKKPCCNLGGLQCCALD